jgi:hypothetical protein
LLGAAAVLNRWSHTSDPRFYAFLRTPMGRSIAQVFGWWRSPLEIPSPTKPDKRMTTAERQVKEAIDAALHQRRASATQVMPTVTYRDVAFRMEFPELRLYVHPPFAILSDVSPHEASALIETLVDTHAWFCPIFQPLFTQAYRQDLIHVLYFARPGDYTKYQRDHAKDLVNTAGFYSPAVNRLVLHRQRSDGGGNPADASRQTLYTIRHEAAHLFLFAYGVHSFHRIENEWLIEGLACLAETPSPGEADPNRALLLQTAADRGGLIPLPGLVNHRDNRVRLLGYSATELAYSQSWALVRFLIQDESRDAFFAYIKYVRDPKNFQEIRRYDRLTLLARFMGRSPPQLEAEWREYVGRL